MANTPKYTRLTFEIHGVDGTNDDGRRRQDVLAKAVRENTTQLTFNRVGKPEKDKHQLIEAVVDGEKVGEISDDDYTRYQTNIGIAKDARIQIYQEELDDGSVNYTADAVIVIPFIQSEESRMKYARRKKGTLIVMGAIILVLTVIQFIQGNIKIGIFGLVMGGLMEYWGIFRKPEKDDNVLYYIKNGKKQHKIGR